MYLAWGPDLIFFNDAYRPILGPRLPHALGMTLPELWPDAWEQVRPIAEKALAGQASRFDDLPITMAHCGEPEDTWWSFSFSPVRDEAGAVAGLFCVTNAITERVLATRRLRAERERFAQMFEQAPSFMALLTGAEHRIEFMNPGHAQLVGCRAVLGRTMAEARPDAAEQGYLALLDRVFHTGRTHAANGARYAVQAEPGGPTVERFVDFVLQPIVDADGRVTGIVV